MPVHEILVLITNASSEGSGETAQNIGMYLKAEAKFDGSSRLESRAFMYKE